MNTSDNGTTIAVHIPMTLHLRGGRMVVISPTGMPVPLTPGAPSAYRADDSLVATVARAFQWQRMLDEGQFATIGDLARAQGLDRSFVSRVLRLTLLAPDIVEAILDRDDAWEIQRQQLLHGFPIEWERQAELAGDDEFL
jgi:hypothetical protein